MAITLWIIRVLASVFLAGLIFVAFGVLLLVNNTDRLFDADFYIGILREQSTYERIYGEVLLDPEVKEFTQARMGVTQWVSHEELVGLFERILPPAYFQAQVEENIRRAVDYLNYDVDRLELYFEMGSPLMSVQPVLLDYVEQRIDGLGVVEPDPSKSLPEQIAEVQFLVEKLARDLAAGRTPTVVPSLTAIPEPLRSDLFPLVFNGLLSDPSLDRRVRQGLRDAAPELRNEFVEGDTHGFLKQVARVAAPPLLDDSLDRVRRGLDSKDRFDLVKYLEESSDPGREDALRSDIAEVRRQLNRVRSLGRWLSLGIVIGGTGAMLLIHLPSLTGGLRWTGLTLLLTGLAWYGLGKMAESRLPDRLAGLIDPQAAKLEGVPPSALELGSDLLRALGEHLADGFGDPALILVAVGALLLGCSFLVFVVRPRIPFVR